MIKTAILAACAAVLAFAGVSAIAAAEPGEPTENPGDPYLEGIPAETPQFNVTSNGVAILTAPGATVTCESFTGGGAFEDTETGWVEFTFNECHGPFGINCNSAGHETPTITTTTLPFHLKTALHEHNEEKEGVGVLITPGEGEHSEGIGHFATFNCSAFFHIEVVGKGIVGTITEPAEEVESNTATIVFEAVENGKKELTNVQTHTTVTHDNTTYDLTSVLNGGETETASQDAHGTLEFHEGVKPEILTTPEE